MGAIQNIFKRNKLITKALFKYVLILTFLFIITNYSFAQTNTWDGSTSNNWNTASNWSLNLVPTVAHDVVIPNNFAVTVNTAAVCNTLTINGGNRTTSIAVGNNSLTVSGLVTINASTQDNRHKYISVNNGAFSCSSITMGNSNDDDRDCYISITGSGSITVNGDIAMTATNARSFILFTGSGSLDVLGTISGGGITSTAGGGSAAPTSGTVNYNNSGDQTIGAYTYYNLTVSNGGTKALAGNTTVSNTLNISSGVIQLADYYLNLSSTNAISGSPFSNTKMVETNGSGYLIRNAGTATPIEIPVGSNGYYSPISISAINNTSGTISARTVNDGSLGSNYLPRYWDILTSVGSKTITATFTYDAAETSISPTNIWVRPVAGSWGVPTGTQSFPSNAFTITGTTDITTTSTNWTAGLLPDTYFSYQTGNWNQVSTWTSDPGGTTQVGSTLPGPGDVVVILPGRTVTLTADTATAGLEININTGGILNLENKSFTAGLASLKGTGTLQLSSTNFPSATVNTFVDAGGGTTVYKNTSSFTLQNTQTEYNNLTIEIASGQVATQLHDLTLNGNLLVKTGTYRINDNAAGTRLILTIEGNVTVNSGAAIAVGQGTTNTTTNPTTITGGAAPFTNYYEQFHRVIIKGNFTNNGRVNFTNLAQPRYDLFPPTGSAVNSGAATVYFQGERNSTIYCNDTTDFYNLILDKGTDQTYILTVQPSAYGYFRLFGANIATTTITANPDMRKALWIRNGTLNLLGMTVIPSLTEGTAAGAEYYIPATGALQISGSSVIVLNTADDYREVDVAYGVTGTSGVSINVDGYQGMVVYGKLQVNAGYLSTRESAGLLYAEEAASQFEINGGVIDAKQFRTYDGNDIGAAYRQTGGTFILRGRFVRPVAYSSISDLSNTLITYSARAVNGTSRTYGTFNLEFGENIFSMTGGTIRIHDASGNFPGGNPQFAMDVRSTLANSNVSGGTIEIFPQSGTVLDDAASMLLWSVEAMWGNVTINRGTLCTTSVGLRNNDLTILKNLIITSGVFNTNNLNVTIGGNFTVSTNGTYNSGINSTTAFNGTRKQTFTIDGTINNGAPGLGSIIIDRTTDSLKLAGTQSSLVVQGTFDLNGGVFADGGKTVQVAGNITNSGVHTGTGEIQLNGTAAQTIGGNGSGIFQNLDLNNSTAANNAPVSLIANTTITGEVTFTTDKSLDISSYSVTLDTASTVTDEGTGTYRYFKTNGEAGDGGITKKYAASSTSFEFPLGVNTYTPATIGFGTQPSVYGSITVKPVNYEHPNVTTSGRSLTYFWRVQSSGFTLGSATISHSYKYADANVVEAGADPLETGYVAAYYIPSTFIWTRGDDGDVDESNNLIGGTGTLFETLSFIDGEFTAGDDSPTNPFGTPTKYYSLQTGLWRDGNNWSTTGHTGLPAGTWPGASDIVIIGNGHTISFGTPANYLTNRNTEVNSCATLQIEQGGELDTRFNPASTFKMVMSHPNGNGTIRVAADIDDGSTFEFPLGDFSDFDQNLGTTELYSTNNTAGTTFWLPNGKAEYGNLNIYPAGRSNIIFPNNNVTINGNCVINGPDPRSWFCLTWDGDYPTAPATRISKTITIKGNLDLQGGSIGWYGGGGGGAQNVIVYGDVLVSTLSGIDVWSSNTSQSLAIGGSLVNNTTGTVWSAASTSHCDFSLLPVTFFGSNSEFITNTGGTPVTIFSTLTINKGTTQDSTLTCDIGGTLTTPASNWLTLQNGTFKYERTGNFTITQNNTFTIPSTAGLYINTPSNVYLSYSNNDGNDVFLEGKLTLASTNTGTTYIGDPTRIRNNDIEYAGGGDSEIEVNGGTLRVNGQIRRNPSMAGGILKYTQSDGSVTIAGQNASPDNAKFEVCNTGSEFNMSGGTLTLIRGGGGATYGDLYLRPHSTTVTGGEIILQPVNNIDPDDEIFIIDASCDLYNFTIDGFDADDAARASLKVNSLVVKGNLTFSDGNSILTTNNLDVTVNGNLVNNGTVNCYVYGSNTTTFDGGVQQITGTAATNFNNMVISSVTSTTLNNGNDVTVNGNLTLSSGTLICGNYAVNLKGNLTNNAAYSSTDEGIIMNGTSLQTVGGTGNYARLEINNLNGVKALNNINLSSNLALTNGIFNIEDNLLSLSQISQIEGTGFGTTKMITTNGVFSDRGISKVFGSGASSFTYPLGVSGKYTKIDVNITANTAARSIRINNVNDRHPAVIYPDSVLQYYWSVESTGASVLTGKMKFYYIDSDVRGDEIDYDGARLNLSDTTWSFPGFIDISEDTIVYNFSNVTYLGDEYTAGNPNAFPEDIPVYRTKKSGTWNDPTVWEQISGTTHTLTGGPNGFIVVVDSTVTTDNNNCKAYRTAINGTFRSISGYSGHNLGAVSGSGTLYLESQVIPAGKYTNFFDCSNNSTLVYGGSGTYTLLADLYDQVTRLRFTGSGTRILPAKDLTICKLFEIDGPTVDNSVNNQQLIILDSMILTSGAFESGTGDNAIVSFSGTTPQTVSNFTGSNTFNSLEINNSTGLTLTDDIEVAGKLLLTDGLITTSTTNTLTITNSVVDCVVPAGGSSSSYVNGPLTKRLTDGILNFQFPVGNATTCGNKLTLRFTATGTLDWTVTYVNPNDIGTTLSGDLTAVNDVEYWNVSSNAGADYKAVIKIAWDPSSNLTPLMTELGIDDMRVARHNGSNWVELASGPTGGSDEYNGSAETSSQETILTGSSGNFTLACVNTVKPRIRLDNSSPVCGDDGIPILLSSSYTIYSPYTVYYKVNNGVTQTLTPSPSSFPATLPTAVGGGTYKLVGFKYNNPSGTERTGAVDPTEVIVYQDPSNANAGPDQSLCGATNTTLAADVPVVGSGLWSIDAGLSDPGGSVSEPTNSTSTFIGITGNTYGLLWTVSNGSCESVDTVIIDFPLLPVKPSNFTTSSAIVCQGDQDVIYAVTNDPSVTYTWGYTGTNVTITAPANSASVDFANNATGGTISVYTTNGCGDSDPLELVVTVRDRPNLTVGINPLLDSICTGDNTEIIIDFSAGTAPFEIVVSDGVNPNDTISGINLDPYTYIPPIAPLWVDDSTPDTDYFYSVLRIIDNNGCSNTSVIGNEKVTVFKIPDTGPQYHISNEWP